MYASVPSCGRFRTSEWSGVCGLRPAASQNDYSDGTGQRRASECAFGCSHSSFHHAALKFGHL